MSSRQLYLRRYFTCKLLQPHLTVLDLAARTVNIGLFTIFIIRLTLSVNTGSLLPHAGVVLTYRTAAVGNASDLSATGNASDLHLTSGLPHTRTNPPRILKARLTA
jgi:hypothetical protein